MIEAVKSTVANSALLRGSVDQSSALNSYAANPDKVQVVSQAPYVSPTVRVDVNTKIAILEFRESDTGLVVAQVPSEQAIRNYKLREAREDAQLLAKLTQRTVTQNGPAEKVNSQVVDTPQTSSATTYTPSQPVAPAPAPASDSVPDISLAAELNALTTSV